MLSLNEKLSEFNVYGYERPFLHCLYFFGERKFYARTHVKIRRQWKSTRRDEFFKIPTPETIGEWVQAFGAMMSGMVWVDGIQGNH